MCNITNKTGTEEASKMTNPTKLVLFLNGFFIGVIVTVTAVTIWVAG